MPRKKSYLTVTDQFCGAGGSSQGVRRLSDRIGGGLEVRLALNHWKLAIETHNTNFPDTQHDCTDISAADPRRYPSTDILITSPECTTHSPAGGNNHKSLRKQMDMFDTGKIDPATERSRATMWDVCRFAEYHQYRCIIVENVVEAKTRWALFDVWLTAMHTLGYNHRCVFLNSMHAHPTPQSRDRMYVVFWKQGQKAPMLDYTPAAHCSKCSTDVAAVQTWKNKRITWGKYGIKNGQYVYCCPSCSTIVEPYYYAAFNCIDWSDIGTRIGDRKRKKFYDKKTKELLRYKGETMLPLAPNSLTRIDYGLDKFGKQPLVVRNQTPGYCRPAASQPVGSLTTYDTHGVFTPFLVDSAYGAAPKLVGDVKRTQTSGHTEGLVTPGKIRSVNSFLGTQTTHQSAALISPPFFVENKTKPTVRLSTGPLSTQTTVGFQSVVMPPFIPVAKGQSKAHHSLAPLSTQCQMINHGVVTPPIITVLQGTGTARTAMRELNGVTAEGVKSGIVTTDAWNAFIAAHYNGSHCASHITEPVGAQSTKERHAIVQYQVPAIEDCYYRMLKPLEIKLAMAFDSEYTVLGSSKDQVKQLGNAVTPPAMDWLVGQCVKSLA